MSRRVSLPGLGGVALAAWLLAAPAAADDPAEARLHFDLAMTLARAGNLPEALTHFLAAQRLAPTANTLYNVAQTYTALGRHEEAYRFYRAYLAHPAATADDRRRSEQAVAASLPRLARLTVTTEPPGATLYVDRVELGDFGVTPRDLAVPLSAGEDTREVAVVVRLAGHREARSTARVTRGQERSVALRLEPVLGTVRVVTDPPGAALTLDGRPVEGATPIAVTATPGRHALRLRFAGRLDVVREVTVEGDAELALEERLPRDLTRASVLSVVTVHPGATVSFRGERLGETPLTRDVDAGEGELRVEMAARTGWARSLLLTPGRGTVVTLALGDPRARRALWPKLLTFGGAGVAAAGAVLGALALSARADFDQAPSRASLDRVGALNLAADVTLGVGLAALVGGVVAWILQPDPGLTRATVRTEALDAGR